MKTEYRLANALKDLMSEKRSLDDISVTLLTKKCKVNRQTFYYHFHDIYDLLTLVFLNEEIPGAKEAKNYTSLLENIFEYYKKNAGFVDSVLESAGKELFVEFISNTCYQTFLKIVALNDVEKQITVSEKRAIARFCAAGFAYNITFYFQNTKRKTIDGLLNNFSLLSDSFLKTAIKNVLRSRGKNGK